MTNEGSPGRAAGTQLLQRTETQTLVEYQVRAN